MASPSAPRALAALSTIAVLLATAPRASAEEPYAPAPAGMTDVDSDEGRARLARVNDLIGDNAAASRRWFFGWAGFSTAVEIYNAVVYATDGDRGVRADAAVTLMKTGLGIVALALYAPPTLFSSTVAIPANATKQEREALLAEREHLFERAAASERFGHGIFPHVGHIAVNTAGFVYMLVAEDVPARATFSFVAGLLVSELKIWTQPRSAMDASDAARANVTIVPTTSREGAGVMLVGRF